MRARWKSILAASIDEAILAVDLYNQSLRSRRLESFFIHMHISWLYLFQAEYQLENKPFHYKNPSGRFIRINGERKTWELTTFIEKELTRTDPVFKNLELTIALRNKIEHRFEEAATIYTSGYAQSLLYNYEDRLTSVFGDKYTLGTQLRYPIYIDTLSKQGFLRLSKIQSEVPNSIKNFFKEFEEDLDDSITQDMRYQFRMNLIPQVGSKSESDMALNFIREEQLTDEDRQNLEKMGKTGTVVVRKQIVPVVYKDLFKPTQIVVSVQSRIKFKFTMHHFTLIWKRKNIRPSKNNGNPEQTDPNYCVFNSLYKDYLYKPEFVEYIVRKAQTEKGFEDLTGISPIPK